MRAWGSIAICVVGCSSLDVAIGPAAVDSSSGSAEGSSTQPTATGTTTRDADPEITTTSLDLPASTSTSAGDESTGAILDATDGGVPPGPPNSPCDAEQLVCALIELDGAPVGSCGATLELKGITQPLGGGRWSLQDCGACQLCAGPQYEVTFFAPAGWTPPALPQCSRIAIDLTPMNDTPFACAFTAVAVWGDDGLGEDPAPVYVGASILANPPMLLDGLSVTHDNIDPEICEKTSCCYYPAGKYTFTFSGSGIAPPLTLAENQQAADVGAFGETYAVRNVRSHVHKECGKIPHMDWVLVR